MKLKQFDRAVESFKNVVLLCPNFYGGFANLAVALSKSGDLQQANKMYKVALEKNPDAIYLEAQRHFLCRKMCMWRDIGDGALLSEQILETNIAVPPWIMLYLQDDPERQLLHSKIYTDFRHLYPDMSGKPHYSLNKQSLHKIRIGYFSSDFHNHATTHLILGLLREHNRNLFEVFAFSYGETHDSFSEKVRKNVDVYENLYGLGDAHIVETVLAYDLDVAIDLKGFTQNERLEIFRSKLAKIHMTYLGYPGTLSSSMFDYAIVDMITVPEPERKNYSESLIFLPNSYQPTDCSRDFSRRKTLRSDWGLPESGVVFCCFNRSEKICSYVFRIWMSVLNRVDNSVLWILESNEWIKSNLREFCSSCGIDPNRLIFADLVSQDIHLERHRHADLFLDTFFYNAHTTASDALFMGIPVITKPGKQFCSRVGASLLESINLSEFITANEYEYEEKIVNLSRNSDILEGVKLKLVSELMTAPLFNTKLFVKHYEKGIMEAVSIFNKGESPRDIFVKTDQ